jgi:riboflavin kinase / FMN adenylyltransferase
MSRRSLVVIGNFDGVHRGHQAVLHTVARLSAERELAPRMLTFAPHPAVTLGRTPPPLLTTLPRKKELVERACPGIEVVVRAFTREFAGQTPEQFVDRVLVADLHCALVMVGSNFRFGHRRAGDVDDLRRLGEHRGFQLASEPLVGDPQGAWSSTRVRACIAAGDVEGAAEILGRPHMLSGTVTRGDQRGRQLGFPTCNIAEAPEALPAYGVYAVLVDREDDDGAVAYAKGVANLGVRPTVAGGDRQPLLEAHLFDVAEDLYGCRLRVHLVSRIRGEQRFEGLDALKSQIQRDETRARSLLSARRPDAALGAWA